MPQIPVLEQQTNVGGGYQGPEAQGAQYSSAIGQAVGSLTGGLREVSEGAQTQQKTAERVLGEQNEQNAKVWAGNAVSQSDLDLGQTFEAQKAAATGGATGFTPTFLSAVDQYQSKALENAPTPLARQFLQGYFTQQRDGFIKQSLGFEASAAINNRLATTSQSIDNFATTVSQDPGKYQTAMDSITATMPDVGPENRTKLLETARQKLAGAVVQNLIATDPVKANQLLQTRAYGAPLQAPTSGAGPMTDQNFEAALQANGIAGPLAGVARSLYAQESTSGTNPAANVPNASGALGPLQITQATFQTEQRQGIIAPNLSWSNPADNLNGSLQYLKSVDAAYQHDPAKIAAVWYSGAKAVNPDGSINNFHDPLNPNAPGTIDYTNSVTGRLSSSQSAVNLTPPSTQPAPATPQGTTGNAAIDSLSADEAIQWSHRAVEASNQVQAQTRIAVDQQAQDQSAAALNGQPPQNPLQLHDFIAAHGAQGPALYQKYADTLQLGSNIAKVATLAPDQQQAMLAAAAPKTSPTDAGYADAQKAYTILSQAIDQSNKQRENDPIGFAAYKGLAQTQPINWNNANAATAELKNRAAVGSMMATKYGAPVAIFSNDEANQLSSAMASSTPPQQIAMLKTLRQGLTDNVAFGTAVGQISKNAPMVGFAGNVAGAPGAVMVNGAPLTGTQIGSQILEGESIWRGTHSGGAAAGTQSPTKLDDSTLRTVYNGQIGSAFQNLNGPYGAKANDEVYQAVRDWLTADAVHNGITFEKASEDSSRVKNAITAVTGGGIVPVGSWGNKSNLLVPWGMDQQAFADQFPARAQATLDAAGLTADKGFDASRYQYDNIGDGKYAFRVGGKYALDPKTGQPLMIDFHQTLAPPVPTPQAQPTQAAGSTLAAMAGGM